MKTILLILALSFIGSASQVQFVSAGPDQPYGPYTLVVDGQNIQATCFNYFAGVAPTWTATEETLLQSGLPQIPMDEIYWLSQQFATTSQGGWWAIHESIWDIGATIFGSPGNTQPFNGWEISYWLGQAQSRYYEDAGNDITILMPTVAAGGPTHIQPFIFGSDPPKQSSPTPEPCSLSLIGIGAVALLLAKRRAHV